MLIYLASCASKTLNLICSANGFIKLICKGETFFGLDRVYDPTSQGICERLVLLLPGRGCAWAKKSGGCTMCGFSQKLELINKGWKLSARDLVALYSIAEMLTRVKKPELLCVFNGGSFLNPNEIPIATQRAIAKAIRQHSFFRTLFVESRPEFITNEAVSMLCNNLGSKHLDIGIGLEAFTDNVRNLDIHKGFSRSDYEKAIRIIKAHNAGILTYVFLKPISLSEKEAIEEAVRTIKYAFSVGSSEVSLSCAFIQQGTPMEKAWRDGKFRPPWLWSIIEVIRRTAHLGPVRVGSFSDEPPPIDVPYNCPKCSPKIMIALQEYNLQRKIEVFDALSCACQSFWKKEK